MRKINITNNEIMTVPQLLAKYKELAKKIVRMEKNIDKQFGKIFEILNKLRRPEN